MGGLLARLGLTAQKPLQRAYQRDPEAIERWQREIYPALARRAKRQRADIYFWDESGFRADAVQGKTWAQKDQTPVVRVPGQRQSISAASAVSAKGAFWFATYQGALNGRVVRGVAQDADAPAQKAAARGARWLARAQEKSGQGLCGHDAGPAHAALPSGYAPDLNPDELVWSHAKRTGPARLPLQKGEQLEPRVAAQLAEIGNRPAMVRSFFKHPSVAYISDL